MMENLKEMKLNDSIINIRVELQNAKLKKSGKNKYAGFNYFELADFLPKLNELMLKYGINDIFTIANTKNGNAYAILKLIKNKEQQTYTIPFKMFETPITKNNQKSMQDIQYLGALNTYYKRYLYINAFGITDGDIIDSMDNEEQEELTEEAAKAMPINFGKYKGNTLQEIKDKDTNYLRWLLENGKSDRIKKAVSLVLGEKPLTEEEKTDKLKLIDKLNELILHNNNGEQDLYEKLYNHYNVKTITELSYEELKDAIVKLGGEL